jgi:hypothetical protein
LKAELDVSLSYIPKDDRDKLKALARVLALRVWMLLRRTVRLLRP